MAEGSIFESSYINVNNCTPSWDSSIIIESIKSKSIAYDGTRVKWCKDYALLQVFIKSGFCMQGKWWSFGGRSKKFDASNADFSIIWYPGKHNTITFKGKIGEQAQEHLIKCCMSSPISDSVEHDVNRKCSCGASEEGRESLFLEIEILKSQVDCLQSLLSSQSDSFNSVGDIINKITRLEIDLEEEKLRNRCLELDGKRLHDEVMSRNSHRDGLVHSSEATDLDKSQYTGEHMTNNEFRNAQNEIMLTNSHCDGLVYLSEKISDLNKSQCINDDTTDLHRDGLVNTKEKFVVDKFNYVNGHTGNKEVLNVKENSHHNVIQQPYNNNHMINTKVGIESKMMSNYHSIPTIRGNALMFNLKQQKE